MAIIMNSRQSCCLLRGCHGCCKLKLACNPHVEDLVEVRAERKINTKFFLAGCTRRGAQSACKGVGGRCKVVSLIGRRHSYHQNAASYCKQAKLLFLQTLHVAERKLLCGQGYVEIALLCSFSRMTKHLRIPPGQSAEEVPNAIVAKVNLCCSPSLALLD